MTWPIERLSYIRCVYCEQQVKKNKKTCETTLDGEGLLQYNDQNYQKQQAHCFEKNDEKQKRKCRPLNAAV